MSLKSQENKRKKESGVIKTRNPEGQKSSHEQKKRRTVNDEPTEESVLFDESNEDVLINSIDKSDLKGETTLPVSKKIIDTSKQEFLQRISKKFKNYQEKIPKLGYWGIFDLTQESLYGCIEFSQSEINEISQGFANSVHWSPQPTPKNLCEYFDSGCDPVKLVDYEDNEKLHTNIQFIIFNMSKKGAKTEEELKFTTIYPLFNAVMDTSLVKDIWGETQALSSKNLRNENANPFIKAHMGRKVDMRGILTRTSNNFEALYGEVAYGLCPLDMSLASQKKKYLDKVKLAVLMRDSLNYILKKWKYLHDNQRKKLIVYGWLLVGLELSLYVMNWAGDGIYHFGLIESCSIPSNKENCALLEGAFCLLKELERKLTETEKLIQEFQTENICGKCRQVAIENSPTLNLNRTP
nr:2844_t:CDS:2 [Entrophospora candida]